MAGTRGQMYTLEAVAASLVVLAAVGFALQATAVTPGGSAENGPGPSERAQAEAVLTAGAEGGALKAALLYWNSSAEEFHCAPGPAGHYTTRDFSRCDRPGHQTGDHVPPNAFGRVLDDAFAPAATGQKVNVLVHYETTSGDRETQRLLYRGLPDDGAVRATTTVTIFDDDPQYAADGSVDGTVSAAPFYAPDAHGSSAVYNVVRVEVIVW